uniref:Neurotransmitter-gated ion-channel ligand-binding domain-containing protein n=1 Tax=Plectus sambesii TaxID=2011161 RepID=A0A914WBT2_9BILA
MKTERIASYGVATETIQVRPDGVAVLSYPNLITQRCHRFDLADFPFDTQRCSARYASWSYSSGQLSLKPLDKDIKEQFREHSEWILEEIKPMHSIETFNNALGESFIRDEVIYDFVLRRKPDHYMYTVAVPCFIITTLSIIGLFAPFSSTGERQEKVTLGLNTLLAVTVLLLMIAEEMPRSMDGESQPLLCKV